MSTMLGYCHTFSVPMAGIVSSKSSHPWLQQGPHIPEIVREYSNKISCFLTHFVIYFWARNCALAWQSSYETDPLIRTTGSQVPLTHVNQLSDQGLFRDLIVDSAVEKF